MSEQSQTERFPELEKMKKKPGPKTQTVSLYPMTVQEGPDIILGKKPKKKVEDLLEEAEKKSWKKFSQVAPPKITSTHYSY